VPPRCRTVDSLRDRGTAPDRVSHDLFGIVRMHRWVELSGASIVSKVTARALLPNRFSENLAPVVLDANDGPPVGSSTFECLLRAGDVVELSVGVVVEHEQA
jgi:hypothetical protein